MKNRSVAILLALFLGGLGGHKFYLGQNVAGVLYLLFSWTFIPSIIAFFEFLGLLMMSDQAFDACYNSRSLGAWGSAKERVSILADLKKLYDAEIITAEEYEEKRRKILDSL